MAWRHAAKIVSGEQHGGQVRSGLAAVNWCVTRSSCTSLYRFRTRRRGCDLWFGRIVMLGQDGGLCLFVCST